MEAEAAAAAAASDTGGQAAEDREKQEHQRMDVVRWQVAADAERAGILQLLRTSLLRPFTMPFTEPVVLLFSLWAAFSWSVLYINLSANAIFAALCLGSTVALTLCVVQESLATRYYDTRKRDRQSA